MLPAFTPEDDAVIVKHYTRLAPAKVAAGILGRRVNEIRQRITELHETGKLGPQLGLAYRTPRTPRPIRAANTGARIPHNAEDNRPLVLGVKPLPVWSWAGRIAREVER